MLALISPAKTLDFESPLSSKLPETSIPDLLDDSAQLVELLQAKSELQLSRLMSISRDLAALNVQRFADWQTPFTADNARPALLAFRGDVYQGMNADRFRKSDFQFAQKHLRILSGLYGVLRPLDLIQAYRLEMGTKLKNSRGRDLYAYWEGRVTNSLNAAIAAQRGKHVINLASNEYFKAVLQKDLDAEVYTPVFKDLKKGTYKVVSFYAKAARGMMADFIVRNRLKSPDQLRDFDAAGYRFNSELSDELTFTFTRDSIPED